MIALSTYPTLLSSIGGTFGSPVEAEAGTFEGDCFALPCAP